MVYLDNAATSFPKPTAVTAAVTKCLKNYCGNPGRGSHLLSRRSAEMIYDTRELVSDFFGLGIPENVIFTYNDTYALNMALFGLLDDGDHVIISDMEHNSVFRPIAALASSGRISYDIFDSMCLSRSRTPEAICKNIALLIRPETKLVVLSHISNICSASLPIKEIGMLCSKRGILFMLDAAQSAGHAEINMNDMNIDILCAPSHKGLYGIMGLGVIIFGNRARPRPIIFGGSGLDSLSDSMPSVYPERLEAGTLSVPAIAALNEGIRYIKSVGISEISRHERALSERFIDLLSDMEKKGLIHIYAKKHVGSVVLLNAKNIPSEKLAGELDVRGICIRSGFHCSPLAHRVLGTGKNGAARFSFGVFNTKRDVDAAYSSLRDIIY